MAYKKLIKVSNVCQLLDKSLYFETKTVDGITYTNNGDGTITINGTNTKESVVPIMTNYKLHKSHFYIKRGRFSINWGYGIQTKDDFSLYKVSNDINNGAYYYLPIGTYDNVIDKPQLFDLTEMYGAGHEPTSVEQFRKDFPEEMYDYSPYCWLNSYKRVFMTGGGNYLTSYKRNLTCKTKNLWTCNKTSNIYTYDKSSQVFTIFRTGLESCYTLPTPINAGETFTISVYCLSGELTVPGSNVTIGGYHFGEKNSWQTDVQLPLENVGGKVYYRTQTTTDTLTDFLIFVYQTPPTNLKVRIQFERGSTATDYVPYGHL